MSEVPDRNNKFVRTHPGWHTWLNKPSASMLFFALLVAYAIVLLPSKETASPVYYYISINVFIVLVLAFSGIILADTKKPDILKMIVALLF